MLEPNTLLLLQAVLPQLEKLPVVQMLGNLRTTVGSAISKEQQIFLSANLLNLPDFIKTPEGVIAIQEFVVHWQNFLEPIQTKQIGELTSG